MDDLAELSEWLGYAQLNINGGSYGTVEAQVFTRRHPDMVRTVIMNGVAPLQDRVYVHHARYLQESLENMYAECAEQSECSEAYPDLQAVTEEVLQTASTRPRLVRAGSMRSPFRIGPLSYALRGLLYGQSGTVPARIYEAKDGNWQTLADYYVQRQSWVGTTAGVPAGYHFSVLCAEDIDPLTWPEIEEASAGTFMGDYLIAGYKRACERWPSAEMPASFFEPVTSNKPVLILSGGRDPVTPVVGGNKIAEQWPNNVHVVVPNGGHGQSGPCITAMLVHLIRTGSVSGIDTSCVQSRPPTAFEISVR
jgi:pimeloyl-ACP methyl ester carboxylesterase